MPTQTITTGTSAQVAADKIFDGVFEQSLHFNIELDFDAVCRFIQRIGGYNDFEAAHVLDALDEVDRMIPKRYYGDGNPNNGQRDYTLKIGREGSPVIYIDRFEFGDKIRLSDSQMKTICEEMELIGLADEADFSIEPVPFQDGRKITFRFWWD